MKWMIDYVKDAPDVSASMLKRKEEITKDLLDIFLEKEYKGIVLVGSGSSYNIALSSKPAMEKYLKIPVVVMAARTYAFYEYEFFEDYLIVCISQSGRSTNTIDAIKRAQRLKNRVVSLSMIPDSPIENYIDDALTYGSYNGEGDSFVSKGYPTSFLFFVLFSIEVAKVKKYIDQKEYNRIVKQLSSIPDEMVKMREASEKFYEANKESIQNSHRNMFAGVGVGYGLTQEACLKFSETTGIPTNGYELEEFLHGPNFEVKKDHSIYVFDLDNISSTLAYGVYESSKLLTNNVFLITDKNIKGDQVLSFETNVDDVFKPMLFVIPVQVIPSRICSDLNVRAITIYNHRASKIVKTKTDK